MKKTFIKLALFLITTLLAIMIFNSKTYAITSSGGYTIESYDINMVVNEDNTFDITENITAYFYTPKHGIFRKIPLRNEVTRLDGTTSRNVAKISNISVSEDYTTYRENGDEVIKIGNAHTTLEGKHSYTIKYTYSIGKDPLKDADELYYNLIGNYWDTSISNVTFKITMPKEFDKSLLGFSSGSYGDTNNEAITYSVDGNTISGYLMTTLNEEEGLTVRLTLPEGYFQNVKTPIDIFSIVVMVVSIIFVLIAAKLWNDYGKDDAVVETVEFYPPEGYNSAEIGFMYEGEASTESVISLLIYLANKGYLKIEEIEVKGLFKNRKSFKITKLKEYDGNDKNEELFIKGLFKKRTSADLVALTKIMREAKKNGEKITLEEASERMGKTEEKNTVTEMDLYDNFYTTLGKIKTNLNSKANKNKIFESSAKGKGKWIIMMIIAIWLLITVKPVFEYSGVELVFFAIVFPGIGISFLLEMLIGKHQVAEKVFGGIWGLGFGGAPCIFMVLPALVINYLYLVTYIVGLICIVALFIFRRIMPKRTPFGNEMLGKIQGFKRFLETAEKQELESLVNKNPEYFYNILPYTYALGVSDVWISQFETIAIQEPTWYSGTEAFNMATFGNFMTNTMNSATAAMVSSPSDSSGSGSSGGGSSGGGSGGGGGGSW